MDGTGGGGSANRTSDAVTMLPTPDNSMTDDVSDSRPNILSDDIDSIRVNRLPSTQNSQLPPLQSSQLSSTHLSQSSTSPPPLSQLRLPPLPPLSPQSPPMYTSHNAPTSLSHSKSPTSAPLNPFYPPLNRASTPPMSSSAEDSPIVSPAKRFSSGEVKPLFSPNSPRQPLNEEDRAKFTQLATQLKARLSYAALKVENGWEKHSFSEIKNILNEEQSKQHQQSPGNRPRSHTVHEPSSSTPSSQHHPRLAAPFPDYSSQNRNVTSYESFWANHSQRPPQQQPQQPTFTPPPSAPRNRPTSSQPHYATFPRRKPERLSLTGIASHPSSRSPISPSRASHTARDQSAAEIMIALASPRTRSEFSSPERAAAGEETDEEEVGRQSPTPRRVKKRIDVEGLGIHT